MPAVLERELQLDIDLQPKQKQLLQACQDRRPDAPTVLGFGGARGAAKSGGVRRIALMLAFERPVIIWIIRRVWDDLNKDHVKPLFVEYPDLQQYWHAGDKELKLPNGSSVFFIHSGHAERARRKARGPQAHYIFLEQAEEFTEEEMEALAGSNRAPGTPPGFCKRIYTFNPGGPGTAYLRRVFHLREFHENEDPADFVFIQGYGWDNYEWFRGVPGIVSEWKFYNTPEWARQETVVDEVSGLELRVNPKRYDWFIHKTDFGKRLAGLPSAQRLGELLGSFERFAGQYYADVWDPALTVISAEMAAKIVKPWWRRWIATDWGFSHYAATGWFASGVLSPEQVAEVFKIAATMPVRVVVQYREFVCSDVGEPDLARALVALTPEAERKEIRFHCIGHDAFAKRGSANTVAEQMDPVLSMAGMPPLSRADIDRVGGWRLLYNGWASARRLRLAAESGEAFADRQTDPPAFFVSAACVETVSAVPLLLCAEKDPTDVEKMAGQVSDDMADMVRYGLKTFIAGDPKIPNDVVALETWQRYESPTARAMAMMRLKAEQSKQQHLARRRRL